MDGKLAAEDALISRLLIDPRDVPIIAGAIDPEDFEDPNHRLIFGAMVKLSKENKAIDLATIRDAAGDVSLEIPVLSLTSAHHAPLMEYVSIIKREAFRRRYLQALERAKQRAYDADNEQDILADLQSTVSGIVQHVEVDHLMSPTAASSVYINEYRDRREKGYGILYGIEKLDNAIQSARGGNMIVLAARPGMGKTAMAQTVAPNWAKNSNAPVLFVSLEMGVHELLDRWVQASGVESVALEHGNEVEAVETALAALKEKNIWLLDNPFATTADIRAAAAKMKMVTGAVGGIVVDYIQLVADRGDPEVTRITRISRALKAIAREFNCPMLVLSQLNRSSEQRRDRHPRLSDLRDSGAIEQDADLVIGLFREQLYLPDMHADILKNRAGPTGTRLFLQLNTANMLVG